MDPTIEQEDGGNDPKSSASSTGSVTAQTPAGSDAGSGTPPGYVTEESYKGLQRATERLKQKMETELAQARQKLTEAATELEEAKLAAAEQENLKKTQADLNTNIQSLQAERDRLTRQLNQQRIVLADFPDLAPLASYIPPADTDEAFKVNANTFKVALQQYVSLSVKGKLVGATPPVSPGTATQTTEEIDRLWEKVYALAGNESKQTEYEDAYAKLLEALKSQQ